MSATPTSGNLGGSPLNARPDVNINVSSNDAAANRSSPSIAAANRQSYYDSRGGASLPASFSRLGFLPTYFRRIVLYPQMDLEYTFTQMVYLMRSPSKVYKLTSWRNQTKNQWARDDPAFVVIICFFLTFASIAYGVALGSASLSGLLRLILINLGLFLGCGMILATFCWWLANSFFRVQHSHSVEQQVEWMYAFDIHCNAFFPMFVALYIVQYLFLPFLLSESFFATLIANTLYIAAFAYYHYVSFLGYMFLPFLRKDQVTSMLYPIAALGVVYVLFIVLNINAARFTLSFFF
mmetsp:Transcript_2720/g.3671  ORF Transcript_2720/g.3671 Transcript_2720/m.3671 type:complete len:294 (+) Transcript_2720:205-1086(+)